MDTAAYLDRLGLAHPGPPSVDGLKALHRAQVERVPYEALEIQLGRPTSLDPEESAARIVDQRRGGYCYHLNGAFSLLLETLGYDVVWHRAGVQNHSDPEPVGAERANHLALTVQGLPSPDAPDGDWLVDAGLGDALHEPLPLRPGTYTQGPFTYALSRSAVEPDGWRFDHDPRGSFAGLDFRSARATRHDFEARHRYFCHDPDSPFARTSSVQRRDATGVDALTGCVLRRVGDDTTPPRTLDTEQEFFDTLNRTFGLTLPPADRTRLWTKVRTAHRAWLAA